MSSIFIFQIIIIDRIFEYSGTPLILSMFPLFIQFVLTLREIPMKFTLNGRMDLKHVSVWILESSVVKGTFAYLHTPHFPLL